MVAAVVRVAQVATVDLAGAGGVEVHILRLAEALRGLGVEVEVIGGSAAKRWRGWGDFDVVHTHGCAVPRGLLRRRPEVGRVHTLHGVSVDYLLRCRAWGNWRCYWGTGVEWLGARAADRVIAVSESVRRRAAGFLRVPQERLVVIGNGWSGRAAGVQEREVERRRLGLREDEVAVLFVGRGEDRVKGAPALAAAVESIRRRRPEVRLVAAPGAGFEGMPGVLQTGKVGYEEMGRLYAAADVFVNASLNEGMPLTVVEAMGAGVAIVAAPVGGIPEVIEDGVSGLLLRRDREDLEAKLERVIVDGQLRARLGAAAAERAKRLTWQAVAKETLRQYEIVLATKKGV